MTQEQAQLIARTITKSLIDVPFSTFVQLDDEGICLSAVGTKYQGEVWAVTDKTATMQIRALDHNEAKAYIAHFSDVVPALYEQLSERLLEVSRWYDDE